MWILAYLKAFFVGLLETFISSLDNKFLQADKSIPCAITTLVYVLVWFKVIGIAIDSLHNFPLQLTYAIACSISVVLVIKFNKYLDILSKKIGKRMKLKKSLRRRKK